MSALSGIRVLDLTSLLMGPFATQLLGEMGADVIKVEAPEGDIVRQIGPQRSKGMGALFLNTNRNKRSIALNLKSEPGKKAFLDLVKTADILTYNVRPDAMDRLGLSYDEISKINSKIIYVGMFGYGQSGPYASYPAFDDLIQAASGLASLMAEAGDGTPRYIPFNLADRMTAIVAVNAILAAWIHRLKSGEGQRIDIPMFETMASLVLSDHLSGLSFDPPLNDGGYDRLLSPNRRPYKTKDGYISVLIYNDKHWRTFLTLIGRTDKIEDPRYATHARRNENIREIYAELEAVFQEETTNAWLERLEKADLPAMPVHTLKSLLADRHLLETGFFYPSEHPTEGSMRSMRSPSLWSRTPPTNTRDTPKLGEHGPDILRELGYSAAELAAVFDVRVS
jgi:crotonobetainyl-CoA:carnitine CoA-transferase CaiB-like acyl-CoA transferase